MLVERVSVMLDLGNVYEADWFAIQSAVVFLRTTYVTDARGIFELKGYQFPSAFFSRDNECDQISLSVDGFTETKQASGLKLKKIMNFSCSDFQSYFFER